MNSKYELNNVISKLESDSQKMLDWFANNLMQANPDKFQALAIGKTTFKEQICEYPFLNFFHFLSIFLTAKMPCYRTISEVG
jgi:hypothetical protein